MATLAYLGLVILMTGAFSGRPEPMVLGAFLMGLPAVIVGGEKTRSHRVSLTRDERELARLRNSYVNDEIGLREYEARMQVYLPPAPDLFPPIKWPDE